MSYGKQVRISRIIPRLGRPVVFAVDDGVYEAPRGRLLNPASTLDELTTRLRSCSFLAYAGFMTHFVAPGMAVGRILSLSISGPSDLSARAGVHSVDYALSLGVDAIALHLSLDNEHETIVTSQTARLVAEADTRGLPILIAAYSRPPNGIPTAEQTVRAVRIAVEIGADIIKAPYPGTTPGIESLRKTAAGVPLLIAGGERVDDSTTLQALETIEKSHASVGICFGRSVLYSDDFGKIVNRVRLFRGNDATPDNFSSSHQGPSQGDLR